ncbi:PaaI family thioesterase [Pseudomonas neustonica]|uniref:PaaI family thioesterase n=1 Tax=Pseudomonas neustonica TaxID=2487346 RepID=A0ABX9XCC8_9PSED|nr:MULTISPECIES: PaaI family thioesterase [Pseudomonas]ROZ79263.1 PaaI family thioesterase [Pseudomonas sp. SSM44]ROZ80125.1 PaaI family thioesterase [Pseudomonas neustonica]|tara:strand:- start:2589 stop:2984 length:396 start_codon:yes stop_codon:yes gene_type:complete
MQKIIEQVAEDPYACFLGVTVGEASADSVECELIIESHMLNFMGIPHGGLLFSLADIALSILACAEHMPAVGVSVTGNYFKTTKVGARVVAKARKVSSGRRFSTFAADVTAEGVLLASFTGTCYKMFDRKS